METRPQSLLGYLITASDLQLDQTLQELHQGLEAAISDVATPEDDPLYIGDSVGKILNEVKDVRVVSVQEAKGVESSKL